jgi:hypothetical protein
MRHGRGGGAFDQCAASLPEWFSDNVDTGCVAAGGMIVAIGTEDGCVFLSPATGGFTSGRRSPRPAIPSKDRSARRYDECDLGSNSLANPMGTPKFEPPNWRRTPKLTPITVPSAPNTGPPEPPDVVLAS